MSAPIRRNITLSRLVHDAGIVDHRVVGDDSVVVGGISHDSRSVEVGDLFFCLSGGARDGHSYASDALRNGAVALVVEHVLDLPLDVPQVVVPVARHVIGPVSSAYFDHPSRNLTVVGVTGTNGKTSTAALLGCLLDAPTGRSRVFGTLSGERTTPEAPDFQRQLAVAVHDGITTVVTEVSSHALAQHRVDGTRFALSVFTNLERDHLDFHGTQEAYFAAKARLFDARLSSRGIANVDDPHGRLLCDSVDIPMVAFSRRDATDVDVRASSVAFTWSGERMKVNIGGEFTVMNVLAACTAARELGVDPRDISERLASFPGVRGRFEYVDEGQDFAIVVDYAHTPDALEQLLRTARGVATGRLIVVFGCGGDRDKGKRPLMGGVAQRFADTALVTSDNPRSEDPATIIGDIVAGFAGEGTSPIVVVDRAQAIEDAIFSARTNDIVVIAGKGHETVQELRDRVVAFDDVVVARTAVQKRSAAG